MSLSAAALCIAAFLIAWLGARVVATQATQLGLVDEPGHRSSHTAPTPTGGGIGLALGTSAAMAWLGFSAGEQWLIVAACLGLALALAGWHDDRKGLSPGVRLLIQAGAVLVLMAWLFPLPSLALPFGLVVSGYGLMLAGVLAALWWINLFNFMDGIDGLAATQVVFMLVGAGFLSWWFHPGVASDAVWLAMLATAASALGFLMLNWPPARVFMGDAGSLFLGFVLVFFAVQTITLGWLSYPAWMILGALFIADATVTLSVRLLRGKRPHEAHRSHAYQRLARRWNAHRSVTLLYLSLNLVWILPLAASAMLWPVYAWQMAALAYMPLIAAVLWLGAGREDHA